MRVGVAPDHDRRALANPQIALPQRHPLRFRQADQLLQSPVHQPRVGRMRDRFRLHRRIDHDAFQVLDRDRARLVRNREAFLEQRHQLRLAEPLPPARQGRAVERQLVAEAQLATEVLIIRVLEPARAQRLVREVVHVLQDEEPGDQPCRQTRMTRSRRAHRGKALIEKAPIDRPRQPRQRMPEVDDLVERRPQ